MVSTTCATSPEPFHAPLPRAEAAPGTGREATMSPRMMIQAFSGPATSDRKQSSTAGFCFGFHTSLSAQSTVTLGPVHSTSTPLLSKAHPATTTLLESCQSSSGPLRSWLRSNMFSSFCAPTTMAKEELSARTLSSVAM